MDYSEEHVAIEWAKAEKISMKRIPGVVPPTPPDLAPGVEYLTDSPFGGTKSITQLPPNPSDGSGPDALRFTVPLRKIGGEIFFPPEETPSGGNSIIPPTRQVTYEGLLNNEDRYEDYDNPSWPALDPSAGYYQYPYVSLADMLSLGMSSPMVMLYAYDSNYPGHLETFMTSLPDDLDMTASTSRVEVMFSFSNIGMAPYISNLPTEYGQNTDGWFRTAFEVPLLYTDGNWNDRMTFYDRRADLHDAINTSRHPFFAYLRRCQGSNPALAYVLNKLFSSDINGGFDVGGGLCFMYDTRDYLPAVLPTDTHPIVLYEETNFKGKSYAIPFSSVQPLGWHILIVPDIAGMPGAKSALAIAPPDGIARNFKVFTGDAFSGDSSVVGVHYIWEDSMYDMGDLLQNNSSDPCTHIYIYRTTEEMGG